MLEANYEQSKLGASRDSGEPLPRWRGIPLLTWSKLNEKTHVSICFLHLLAKAPKHFGLVRKSLWSPNYTQHARKQLCFNWS